MSTEAELLASIKANSPRPTTAEKRQQAESDRQFYAGWETTVAQQKIIDDASAWRTVPCPYCKARAGSWCWTESGEIANEEHEGRKWVLIGYVMGATRAVEQAKTVLAAIERPEL